MSRYVGAGNSKIVTRDQGGGNKKSGGNTSVGNPKSTTTIYRSQTGPINYTLACVNQLGGISRGRSQFRNNADGKRGIGCSIQELYKLIAIINNGLKLDKSVGSDITYKLVIAGSTEKVITDLSNVDPSAVEQIESMLVNPNSSTIFGRFSHNSYNRLKIPNYGISYEDIQVDIHPNLQLLINRANHLLKILIPELYTEPIIKRYGIHELAVLSNITNVGNTGYSIKDLLNTAGYGKIILRSNPPLGIFINWTRIIGYFRSSQGSGSIYGSGT